MKRYLGLVAVYSFSVVLAFELAGRVNFFAHHHLSFWTPASHLAYRFYPNLKPIMEDNRPGGIRVLVLGGSALNKGWGNFEGQLHDQLSAMLGQEVRVFNTSMPARTSLDSYYKYWFLRDKHFDLVILYNSINDCGLTMSRMRFGGMTTPTTPGTTRLTFTFGTPTSPGMEPSYRFI